MAHDTIPSRFFAMARRRPEEPAYFIKSDGRWQATRWKDYASQVRRAAKALIALGIEPGGTVGLLGFNRPEWTTLYLAALSIGAAPVGIYTTCSAEEVQYVVAHAESSVVLVENVAQWEKLRKMRGELPSVKRVVMMRGAPPVDDPLVQPWEEFLGSGSTVDDARVDERLEALDPKGLATLIYTSGTTGPPKGVMLSHENIAWTAACAANMVGGKPGDVLLSYLPLSHIAEQMLTIHGGATIGMTIYFAQSLETVPDDLKSVQPTVFFGVPRIWEKFHAAVSAKLSAATGAKAKLLRWARWCSRNVHQRRDRGESVPMGIELQYKLASKLVFSKLKPALGLGNAAMCVSGAAPVGRDVIEFFQSIDLPIREVYGQSEGTGPTSFNMPGATKLGTVGKVIAGCEVTLAGDGEILVRGPNVFMGYYKDPAATAATLVDGWLQSGDLGAMDGEGYLSITGRKKEIIITSGGKNITPRNIEEGLKSHDLIAEAVLIGDRRPYLVALLVLSPEGIAKLAGTLGRDVAALTKEAHTDPAVRAAVQKAVDSVNLSVARVEQVKKFAVLPRALDVDHGELTPSLKIKRRIVDKVWAETIEGLYAASAEG